MSDKAKTAVAVILILLVLLGAGGGIFYLSYIDSVSITNKNPLGVEIGDEVLLLIDFPEKIYLNKGCHYSSSNPNVVSVDKNGKIKALGVGSADITVKTKWYNRTDTITVNVGYGCPDEVKVEVQNAKQYVGDTLQKVVFTATTTRKGIESQDPNRVKFRWEIYDKTQHEPFTLNAKLIKTVDTSENKLEYAYESNKYQNIFVKCKVLYDNTEKDTVQTEQEAFVYEPLKAEDFSIINASGNPIASSVYMGDTLAFAVSFSNNKVDNSKEPTFEYEINGTTKVLSSNSLLFEQYGTYTVTAIFQENGKTITKSVVIKSNYKPLQKLEFDKTSLAQPPEKVEDFNLTVSWSEYSSPNQNITFALTGRNKFNTQTTYEYTVNSTTGSASIKIKPTLKTSHEYEIYVVEGDIINKATGIILNTQNKDDKLGISASCNDSEYPKNTVATSPSDFTYKFATKKAENVKIFADSEDISGKGLKEESDLVVGRNNINKTITLRAETYPYDSYADCKWYVNKIDYTDHNRVASGSEMSLYCNDDIGEYHIYCVCSNGNGDIIKSNTLVIPSIKEWKEGILGSKLNYIGDVNGRSVNHYVTSQSDLDALMEYYILKKETSDGAPVSIPVYIDTCMQSIWNQLSTETICHGERFWANGGKDTYYYVDNSGKLTGVVPKSSYNKPNDAGLRSASRLGYSGGTEGSVLTENSFNKNISLSYTRLPTDVPESNYKAYLDPHKEIKQDGYNIKPYKSVITAQQAKTKAQQLSGLPIDEIEQTMVVSTSSELFDAVENGYKPICKKGSRAEQIYIEARKVLLQFGADKMPSDYEKVKFINDWIVYEVTYNHAVTKITETQIKKDNINMQKFDAFYLEGVFSIPGFESQVAVCDGKSKAVVLMCSILGIRSVRVVGMCSGALEGGHAWNKVFIREKDGTGDWYLLDTTWNDKGNEKYEEAVYDYFLVADSVHETTTINKKTIKCVEDDVVGGYPKATKNHPKSNYLR